MTSKSLENGRLIVGVDEESHSPNTKDAKMVRTTS